MAYDQALDIDRYLDSCDALMFDLDGTLVDTMPLHYRAYSDVLRSHDLHLALDDYLALVGPPALEVIGRFVTAAGGCEDDLDAVNIHAEKKDAFDRLLSEGTLNPLPASRLLDIAVGRIRCALVSSGNRRGVHAILASLGWTERFEAVITGDDVERGKPNPEPYLRAANLLRVQPARCAAFEDTSAGLQSARSAGMLAIDVTRTTLVA